MVSTHPLPLFRHPVFRNRFADVIYTNPFWWTKFLKECSMHHPEAAIALVTSRRSFLRSVSVAATASVFADAPLALAAPQATGEGQTEPGPDAERMRALAAWTALTMETPDPVPYGAEIFHSSSGERLMRATNAVGPEHDPSAHAEVRTIRLACSKLNSYSLRGYTLYTTCEPCPMCMACALWAGLDRVVYGATIADAARFGHQIQIPAAEVEKRADMRCVVDGPVEHDVCLALFTNPNMQKAFKRWNSQKP
jgi:tRNA(Arg) A34 adenosine deaminase TadA